MYQPTPELMYKIAEACGISGSEASESLPIIENIDINPMLCKSMEEPPTFRQMIVGRSVSKRSSRIQEDGTSIWSSLCTSEYNVWERCMELWSKEESYCDGYSVASKYPPKYDSKYKRRAHFDSEMKFAHAKAETKAHLKTVRELAGLPTGYKPADLTSGVMVFSRIRRSRETLKLETAARLQAISTGGQSRQLFSLPPAENIEPSPEIIAEDIPEDIAPEHEIPVLARALMQYLDDVTDPEIKGRMDNAIKWIESDPEYEANTRYYQRSIELLKLIEKDVPKEMRFAHTLY